MAGQGSRSAMLVLLGTVAIVLLSCIGAEATEFQVGGGTGNIGDWQIPTSNGAFYDAWSAQQSFSIGDTIVFQYNASQHNVWKLPNATAYQNCDFSGDAIQFNTTGKNTVPLTSNVTYWFACSVPTHCSQGMKLKVNVGNVTVNSTSPSSAPAPAPSSASRTAMGFGTAAALVTFAAFFLL